MLLSQNRMAADVGFARAEMGSERLAGSAGVAFPHHIFLVWGKAADWPDDVFQGAPGALPSRVQDALKKGGAPAVRLTIVEGGPGDREGDVLIFPAYVKFRLGPNPDEEKFARLRSLLSGAPGAVDLEDLAGPFAFICSHARRDARCGHCGPKLEAELESQNKAGKSVAWNVRRCSHVGGHKYAGNVIAFMGKGCKDDGHWYGYVTPENLASVLSGREARGPLWRGRLGLTEKDAVIQRGVKVAKDVVSVAVAIAAVSAVVTLAVRHLREQRSR